MNNNEDVSRFVRDIRGPAASILWALVLTNCSLKSKVLCRVTGYSDKSIAKGLQKLQAYDIVQSNGQYGWSIAQLPFPLMELWQGYQNLITGPQVGRTHEAASKVQGIQGFPTPNAGTQGTQPVDNFLIPSTVLTEFPSKSTEFPSSPRDLDLGWLVDNNYLDQDIKPTNQPNQESNLKLIKLLNRLGIQGRVLKQLQSCNHDIVLAWHWWSLVQDWLKNPVGYVISRLKAGEMPQQNWVEAVEWWGDLDAEDRYDVLSHISGKGDDGLWHMPATSGADLARYLRADEIPLPKDGALEALMLLEKVAWGELENG